MTRARITAAQATRPPKGMRMIRGTVTVVSPLTVQIAGGGAVTGLAVPGQRYTVGDAVLVAVQEPAVGPVYPLAPTPAPDLTPYAKTTALPATTTGTLSYAGTTADFAADRKSSVTRFGPLATLNFQATAGGTGPAKGATLATLPAGFAPTGPIDFTITVYNGDWNNQAATLELTTDRRVVLVSATVVIAAGFGLFGAVTYPAI